MRNFILDDLGFVVKIGFSFVSIIWASLLQITVIDTSNYFHFIYFVYAFLGHGVTSIYIYREYLLGNKNFKERFIEGNAWKINALELLGAGLLGFLLSGVIYVMLSKIEINGFIITNYIVPQIISVIIGMLSQYYLEYQKKGKKIIDDKLNNKNK